MAFKKALEALFYSGEITSAGRTTQFARRYDLAGRVIPPDILSTPMRRLSAWLGLGEVAPAERGDLAPFLNGKKRRVVA